MSAMFPHNNYLITQNATVAEQVRFYTHASKDETDTEHVAVL